MLIALPNLVSGFVDEEAFMKLFCNSSFDLVHDPLAFWHLQAVIGHSLAFLLFISNSSPRAQLDKLKRLRCSGKKEVLTAKRSHREMLEDCALFGFRKIPFVIVKMFQRWRVIGMKFRR